VTKDDGKSGAGIRQVPFDEKIGQKVAKKPAIIVQEELERKVVWMNLWPTKKGPYDPLTYDVRRTSTVRVMLHGPWIEMRFPKRNLPLRRMHDDVEPKRVDYHDRVEVIDLSTCSIDLLPENLPSKRMWSRKYPIRIRTNTRKPLSQDSNKMAAAKEPELTPNEGTAEPSTTSHQENASTGQDATEDVVRKSRASRQLENEFKECDSVMNGEAESGSDQTHHHPHDELTEELDTVECEPEVLFEDAKDFDEESDKESKEVEAKEEPVATNTVAPYISEDPNKTFYLFTRTGREKEEWFNRFMVAANFMEDWEHQNPKPGQHIDPNFETHKVREQKFTQFMEDYFQAKNSDDAAAKLKEIKENPEATKVSREQLAFVNIYLARMWHDLHDSKDFIDYLREKITKKLTKVRISQYFDEMAVTTLDLGPKLPQVLNASLPWQDELGLWVDLDVEYNGVCQATVETKGLRLPGKDEPDPEAQALARLFSRQGHLDSDEEDSAEEDDDTGPLGDGSASDDNDDGTPNLHPHAGGFKDRLMDSVLKSNLTKRIMDSEVVKKYTSQNITLQLQLHRIKGTITINFPPSPSDRIWWGFRHEPETLEIALKPYLGNQSLAKYERTINMVTKKLVEKLKQEVLKILVYPNLDDEVLTFLNHVEYNIGGSGTGTATAGTPVTENGTSQAVTSNAANADTTDEPGTVGAESTHIISTSPSNTTNTAAASPNSKGGDQKEAVDVGETADSSQVITETLVLSETEIRSRKSKSIASTASTSS